MHHTPSHRHPIAPVEERDQLVAHCAAGAPHNVNGAASEGQAARQTKGLQGALVEGEVRRGQEGDRVSRGRDV